MLILASQSPRRKTILRNLGISFRVVLPRGVTEVRKPHEAPERFATRLALEKVRSVSRLFTRDWVLGADTIIVLGERIFGKPKDRKDAQRILMALQGKEHEVLTGVALVGPNAKGPFQHLERTRVRFKSFSSKDIKDYLKTREPYDKAGAYDIRGKVRKWIVGWEGEYFNVLGLPADWVKTQSHRFQKSL